MDLLPRSFALLVDLFRKRHIQIRKSTYVSGYRAPATATVESERMNERDLGYYMKILSETI